MLYCKTCQVVYFRYPMEKYQTERYYVEVVAEYDRNMQYMHQRTEKRLTNNEGCTSLDNPICPVELKACIAKEVQFYYGYHNEDSKVPKHEIIYYLAKSEYYNALEPYMRQNKLQLKKLNPKQLLEVTEILSRALNS